jgi:histidine triad (HIT) family protein
MYNHAPTQYVCPICLAIDGKETEETLIRQSDIVYNDELVTAFISSFFIGNNPGHVIIVPKKHFENIYDLPSSYAHRIQEVAKQIALTLKHAYHAEGITTLQNNEPAGNQHAFHYHFHVFPRYMNDELHKNMLDKKSTTQEERADYAKRVIEALQKSMPEFQQ